MPARANCGNRHHPTEPKCGCTVKCVPSSFSNLFQVMWAGTGRKCSQYVPYMFPSLKPKGHEGIFPQASGYVFNVCLSSARLSSQCDESRKTPQDNKLFMQRSDMQRVMRGGAALQLLILATWVPHRVSWNHPRSGCGGVASRRRSNKD